MAASSLLQLGQFFFVIAFDDLVQMGGELIFIGMRQSTGFTRKMWQQRKADSKLAIDPFACHIRLHVSAGLSLPLSCLTCSTPRSDHL